MYLGKPALCGIGRVEKIKNQRLALDTAKKQSVGHVLDMLFAFGYYLERHYPGRAQIRGALPHSDDGCYLPRCSGWIYLAKERGGYWEEAWDPDTPAAYVFSGITLEGIRDWVVNPDDQYCRPKGDEIDFVAANLDEVYARWASNPADPPPPPPRPTANTPFFACRDGHYLVHLDGLEAPEAELTTLENWDLEQIRTDFIARTGAPESAQVRVLAWRVLQAPGQAASQSPDPSPHQPPETNRVYRHMVFAASEYPAPDGSGAIWALAVMERAASATRWNAAGDFSPATGRGPVACIAQRPNEALLRMFLSGSPWNKPGATEVRAEGTLEAAWKEITGERAP